LPVDILWWALAKEIAGDKLKKASGWFVLVMGKYILVKEYFSHNHD
jgi:hypothetical protein